MLTAYGFDWPMGTEAERRSVVVPAGLWHIGNPYLNYYYLGPGNTNPAYHTGDDTSIEPGGGKGQPIHACANGEITFAARILTGSWGNLIIQHCVLPNGQHLYIRYAHSDPMYVKAGDTVVRGQVIALESDAFGRFYPHLHLDFSLTNVLRDNPSDWPGVDAARAARDYIDPVVFIRKNRPMATIEQVKLLVKQLSDTIDLLVLPPAPPPPPLVPTTMYVSAGATLNVRFGPSTSFAVLGTFNRGDTVSVIPSADPDWMQIASSTFKNGYVYTSLLSATRP